jgi:hypothetical protein
MVDGRWAMGDGRRGMERGRWTVDRPVQDMPVIAEQFGQLIGRHVAVYLGRARSSASRRFATMEYRAFRDDCRPSTIDHRPLTIDHRPSTIAHGPLTIDYRP